MRRELTIERMIWSLNLRLKKAVREGRKEEEKRLNYMIVALEWTLGIDVWNKYPRNDDV